MDILCKLQAVTQTDGKRWSGEAELTEGWTQDKWESVETSYKPEE